MQIMDKKYTIPKLREQNRAILKELANSKNENITHEEMTGLARECLDNMNIEDLLHNTQQKPSITDQIGKLVEQYSQGQAQARAMQTLVNWLRNIGIATLSGLFTYYIILGS